MLFRLAILSLFFTSVDFLLCILLPFDSLSDWELFFFICVIITWRLTSPLVIGVGLNFPRDVFVFFILQEFEFAGEIIIELVEMILLWLPGEWGHVSCFWSHHWSAGPPSLL